LSGGQKARLALARAIYTEADIYLLDDPISAVDAKVAKIIYQNCLRRLAETSTVILVTHQIGYIYECDEAIIMDDGEIIASGQPAYVSKYLEELSQVFKEEDEKPQADP
jgi:ATP-binding cassette, subfamily C (CFTR/MRP), member 4